MNAEMTRHIESQLKDLKLKGILGCYRDIAEKASAGKLGYEGNRLTSPSFIPLGG